MFNRSLVYFREVARTKSISEASINLRISVSALSRQISRLEETLGVALFERRPRGMVLTVAGELLLNRSQRLAMELEDVLEELKALSGKSHGQLRIASFEGFALDYLVQAIDTFQRDHATVSFDVWIGPSPDICDRIREGAADIGITYSYPTPPGIAVQRLVARPIHAVLCKGHRLCDRTSITLDDLKDEPLAVPAQNRTQRHLLEAALAARGLPLDPLFATNSMALLREYGYRTGTTMITASPGLLGRAGEDVILVPIDDPVLATSSLQVITMAGRPLSATMAAFLEEISTMLDIRPG